MRSCRRSWRFVNSIWLIYCWNEARLARDCFLWFGINSKVVIGVAKLSLLNWLRFLFLFVIIVVTPSCIVWNGELPLEGFGVVGDELCLLIGAAWVGIVASLKSLTKLGFCGFRSAVLLGRYVEQCDEWWNVQLASSFWLGVWILVDLYSSCADDEIIFEINLSKIETGMAWWNLKLNAAMFIWKSESRHVPQLSGSHLAKFRIRWHSLISISGCSWQQQRSARLLLFLDWTCLCLSLIWLSRWIDLLTPWLMGIVQSSGNFNHQGCVFGYPGSLQGSRRKWSLFIHQPECVICHSVASLKPFGYPCADRFDISTLMNWDFESLVSLIACLTLT